MTPTQPEPGSFRDPQGRVFYRGQRILRALNKEAAASWQELAEAVFFRRLIAGGKVVGTTIASDARDFVHTLAGGPWRSALEHEPVRWISYPYEWTFSMLQAAALLQLELLREALANGFTLKDATPYNVQWRGAQPVFIDVLSFERWRPGDPWAGYSQFCQLFLYPLLLTAHRGVPFQPWLRGAIDGIPVEDVRGMFSLRDVLRPGVFFDVIVHARLQRRVAGERAVGREEIVRAGFGRDQILRNLSRLERIVSRLRWQPPPSTWSRYEQTHDYSDDDRQRKLGFVRSALMGSRPRLVWDLGSNTGAFSVLAGELADYVVAFDSDHQSVERLFNELRRSKRNNVLPLVTNLADPSPQLGWRLRERTAIEARGRPDLVLCLALVHHLVLGANIPIADLLDWLVSLRANLIIEYIESSDPLAQLLVRNRAGVHHPYSRSTFEAELKRRFDVVRQLSYHDGTRELYLALPRADHDAGR